LAIALAVGGLFFPQSQALGLDRTGLSPAIQRKVTYAGANKASFQEASQDLEELLEFSINPKEIERVTRRIGQERLLERDAAVEAFKRRPLVEKDIAPHPDRPIPAVAMVSIDGGRLQMRSGVDQSSDTGKTHWRESKAAVLETYAAQSFEADPDPDVPQCFLELKRCVTLVQGLGHTLPAGLSKQPDDEPGKFKRAEQSDEGDPQLRVFPPAKRRQRRRGRKRPRRPGCPQRLVRSVLASRCRSKDFGPIVQQAAWERNFFGAGGRAFLGDGQSCNWKIHRVHFPTFTPVADFVHALSYIFAAAMAGRSEEEGFATYLSWIQQVWAGQADSLIEELEKRSSELGPPPKDAPDNDPRCLVAETLCYLRNNAHRMRYDEYRRCGLPIMTSAVESTIKQINRRVKGSEKFWSEDGAEAILQLRADYLSETNIMVNFWKRRQSSPPASRRRRRAA
jgi:hypothetical protein